MDPFDLLETNQWDVLIEGIQSGRVDVNAVNAEGKSLLMEAYQKAPSLDALLLKLGANVNFVMEYPNRPPMTLLDIVIGRGALQVPRERQQSADDIIRQYGQKQAFSAYLLYKSQGAMTYREIANRGIAEVVVNHNLPDRFSRVLGEFLFGVPPPAPLVRPLQRHQQRRIDMETYAEEVRSRMPPQF